MKNRIIAILAAILLTSFLFTACAEGLEAPCRASEVINSCKVTLSKSGTKLTATATIIGEGTCDKIGFKYVFIQELRDGKWVTVASDYDIYGYDTFTKRTTLNYTGEAGKEYRVTASGYAEKGGVSDTRYAQKNL